MKFRAIAVGLTEDSRAVECYASNARTLRDWGIAIAAQKHTPVDVYVTEERLVMTIGADGVVEEHGKP